MEAEGSLPCSQHPTPTLSWASCIQFRTSHPISIRSIPILPSNLHWGFPTKIFYAFLVSPMRATWPTYLILLDFIISNVSETTSP
jgi:hypothetical protein